MFYVFYCHQPQSGLFIASVIAHSKIPQYIKEAIGYQYALLQIENVTFNSQSEAGLFLEERGWVKSNWTLFFKNPKDQNLKAVS